MRLRSATSMAGLFPCRRRNLCQGLRRALLKRLFLMCRGWPGRFIRLSNLSRLPVAKGIYRLLLSQLCKVRSVTCRYLAQAASSMPRDLYIALNLEASCMRESGSWRRRYIRHLFIYNVYFLTLCYVNCTPLRAVARRKTSLVGSTNQRGLNVHYHCCFHQRWSR